MLEVVAWAPQEGPQHLAFHCPTFEMLYGGARGGGKSQLAIGKTGHRAIRYGEHFRGLLIRRSRVELVDWIEEAQPVYHAIGAEWRAGDHLWRMPGGGVFWTAYLANDHDASLWQGRNITDLIIEEITNFPHEKPLAKLRALLRSGAGVPPQMLATGNPGGAGHQHVKARYIDPMPPFTVYTDPETGLDRVFIPARVTDNRILLDADPTYIARIRSSGSPELVRAWLDGDWDVVAGAFYPELTRARHCVEPFAIPKHWLRFQSMDWGYAEPSSIGWYAVSDGEVDGIPRGALVRYREWYTMVDGRPNTGTRLDAEDQAQGILLREDAAETIQYRVADPSMHANNGGPSLAERMYEGTRGRVDLGRGDNTRRTDTGHVSGHDQIRARLRGNADGDPMLYVFSTCQHFWRTMPAMQHDERMPERMADGLEDHVEAELRYALLSRPYVTGRPPEAEDMWREPTFGELAKMQRRGGRL